MLLHYSKCFIEIFFSINPSQKVENIIMGKKSRVIIHLNEEKKIINILQFLKEYVTEI